MLLAAIVLALWAHAALLSTYGALQLAGLALRAVAAAVALLGLALFAAGTEGFRPAALVPALLAAAAPAVAASFAAGGREPFVAALYAAGAYRAFAETHVAGRLPLSALLFGAGAALAPAGPLVLVFLFAQRMAFARRFRLRRDNYVFAGIWVAVAVAAWALLRAALGRGPVLGGAATGGAASAPAAADAVAGPITVLGRFWREADGLALLPFVLFLLAGWKSKAVIFRLTLAGAVLAGALAGAARASAAALPGSLAPALLFAFLIAAEALAAAGAAVEAGGLRGRGRGALFATTLCALVLGQLWPTLARLAR